MSFDTRSFQSFDPLNFNSDTESPIKNDRNILREFDDAYNEAYMVSTGFFSRCERDLEFYLGKQWSDQEMRDLESEGRNAFVFNKIRRVIDMITGYQRRNRLSSVCVPIEDSDQKTSDQFTSLMLYVLSNGGYECISDCFGGALKTAINLCEVWLDHRSDPMDGDIRFSRIPYNGVIIDPYFTKLDLSDCNYILRRKYMSKVQAMSIMPSYSNEIAGLPSAARDEKFTYLPEARKYIPDDYLALDEYWRTNYNDMLFVFDPKTGVSGEIEPSMEAVSALMNTIPDMEIVPFKKKYIEKSIIIGREVITTVKNPHGIDIYPFAPFVGVFAPEAMDFNLKLQSFSNALIDPQIESNKRRSQMTDILESSINSGYLAKENSVVNPRSLFRSGQGKVTWIKEEYQMSDVQQHPPAQVPPSMFQLQQLYDQDIIDIAGINQELLGASSDDDAGITVKLRQGAGLITLQNYFDNLSYSQKQVSKIVMKFLQEWSPQKVMRILNEEPTQEFYSKDFGKYDCSVQEGILTDTQKQMFFYQMLKLKEIGEPIPPMALTRAAPIQGKSDLYEEMQAMSEQQAKEAEIERNMALQDRQATLDFTNSQTAYAVAGAEERKSRSVSNLTDVSKSMSQAEENRAGALLDKTKAMSELQAMDISMIERLLNIIRAIKEDSPLIPPIPRRTYEREE